MLRFIQWCSIVCLLLGLSAPAQAQSTYPDRPIRFVIAFPPGGATDTFFRLISNELATALGQSIVIENKGGAGGTSPGRWSLPPTRRLHGAGGGERAGINQALYTYIHLASIHSEIMTRSA
jgi:hypothetical protein